MEQKEKKPKEGKKRDYSKFAEFQAEEPFVPKKERKMQQILKFEAKERKENMKEELFGLGNVDELLLLAKH